MGNKIPNWSKTYIAAGQLPKQKSLFEFVVRTLDGDQFAFDQLRKHHAIMVVNCASKCKLTPQHYKELVEIEGTLKKEAPSKSFQIIGFPCGQFSNQEFDTADEIKEFVKQYNVDFPLMEKTQVNGDNTHPVFKFLKMYAPTMHEKKNNDLTLSAIEWNFGKFLVDHEGHVVNYYSPKVTPKQCVPDILKVMNGELKGHVDP